MAGRGEAAEAGSSWSLCLCLQSPGDGELGELAEAQGFGAARSSGGRPGSAEGQCVSADEEGVGGCSPGRGEEAWPQPDSGPVGERPGAQPGERRLYPGARCQGCRGPAQAYPPGFHKAAAKPSRSPRFPVPNACWEATCVWDFRGSSNDHHPQEGVPGPGSSLRLQSGPWMGQAHGRE